MCLESFYFLSICYGWYRWSSPQKQKTPSLIHLSGKKWGYLCVILIATYSLIYTLLITLSHSTVAKLDALTTTLSLVAQWLMCHKIIATSILWFLADALYALMYLYKDLPFHTLLMFIYTGLAIIGYARWHKQSRTKLLSLNLPMNESTV
jgi:nicotinamide mononucleotide transporter